MKKEQLLRKIRSNNKGSSLVAVLVTITISAIIIMAASGIALTNYMTSKNVTSQDKWYYSAETSQAQYVSNLNDYAYSLASEYEWSSTSDASYKTNAKKLYNDIASAATSFQDQIGETVYNNEYKVTNELKLNADGTLNISADGSSCTFVIETTVTKIDGSGTPQTYTSEVTVECPHNEVIGSSSNTYLSAKDKYSSTTFFNNNYALVSDGSGKNTDWYGIWGQFNTYTTVSNNKTPVKSTTNCANVYTTESTPTSKNASTSPKSGIYFLLGDTSSHASNPYSGSYLNYFKSVTKGSSDTIDGWMDTIIVNVCDNGGALGILSKVSQANTGIDKTFSGTSKITLNLASGKTVNDEEKFYYSKYAGDVDLNFSTKPANRGSSSVTITGPSYRTCATSTGVWNTYTTFEINSNDSGSKTYTNTYQDHYYKNKWFFVDLAKTDGSYGTLKINNSTITSFHYDVNFGYYILPFWWFPAPYLNFTDYKAEDEWGFENYVNQGNIVMEDCYFFVNGNIEIQNAYNMSNCKFFATQNIVLDSVYYTEGMLSLETSAGSNTIKESLYYCDGTFVSNLISRYCMAWGLVTTNAAGVITDRRVTSASGSTLDYGYWFSDSRLLSNNNTYTVSQMLYWVWYYTNGYLATYKYPTVLKATIIAKGSNDFTPRQQVLNNSKSSSATTCTGCSVILNPDGDTYGVVDSVLIEGQIFSKNKIYTGNYNWDSVNATNRYSASNQIQYQSYSDGHGNTSLEDTFAYINSKLNDATKTTQYNPLNIVNGGIYRD